MVKSEFLNKDIEKLIISSPLFIKNNQEMIYYVFSKIINNWVNYYLAKIENYDISVYNHSLNVSIMAALLSYKMGYNFEECFKVATAGILHDIGKIKLPIELINYPGRYNVQQRNEIEKHPLLGGNYLSENRNIPHSIINAVYQHHEYCDGSGYPEHLKSVNISEYAKIITVCDIYEAYTAKRTYHDERSFSEGIKLLKKKVELGQLDFYITREFINLFECYN